MKYERDRKKDLSILVGVSNILVGIVPNGTLTLIYRA